MTDAVRVTRLLKASLQDVFDAWTDPHIVKQWMCPDPGVVGEVTCHPVVGGKYRLVMVFEHGTYVITGQYLEVEPPRRLVFTWRSDRTAGPTQVTVTLRPEGDLTEMTILHERLPTQAYRDSAGGAWANVLGHLEAVLATSAR
jgi:uncharacterized protein YndB with AHSA1/START domain